MQPPFKPLSSTSYPDPGSKVPILSHGPTHSTLPSTSVRQACLEPLSWLTRPIRYTRPAHGCFNNLNGCRPSTAGARSLTAPRLLHESEFGTTKIQCLRQWAAGDLRGCEILPSHAGGPAFNHPDATQVTHLRLPSEEGQMLTTPIQTPRLHLSVYNRHPPYIRPWKHRRRRTFQGWGNHGASDTWRACRFPGRRWRTADSSGE